MYYRITRWLFGNGYVPFETSIEEAEIHPLSQFIMNNYEYIRLIFTIFPSSIPIMSIVTLVIYLTQRIFFYGMDYYYLKVKCCIVE
jgi:hypothetical protein